MGGFVSTLRTWGDRASFEADRFMRANRVRSDITRLKKDIEAAYAQIGHSVVEMHQTGRLPDAAVIDEAVARIHQLERDLQMKDAEALNIQNEKWVEDAPHPQSQVIEGQQSPAPFPNSYGGPPAPAPQPYALPTGSYAQQQQAQTYQQPPQSYEQPPQSYQPPATQQPYQQPAQSYQQPAVQPTSAPATPLPPAPPPAAVSAPADTMTQAMPIRHCSKCGTELRPAARFCPVCGTPAPLGNG
jgi:hypothetical protein